MSLTLSTSKVRGGVAFNKKENIVNQTVVASGPAPIEPVSGTQSTLTLSPTSMIQEGPNYCTATVFAKDAVGTPFPGKLVVVSLAFTLTGDGPSFHIEPLTTGSDTTDATGNAYFKIYSTHVGLTGNSNFQAVIAGVTVSLQKTLTLDPQVTSATNSSYYVPPLDDNNTNVAATVTLRSLANYPIPNRGCIINPLPSTSNLTITPASPSMSTTDNSGVALFTISATVVGSYPCLIGDGVNGVYIPSAAVVVTHFSTPSISNTGWIQLNWSMGGTPPTSWKVYGSTTGGAPYSLITTVPAATLSYLLPDEAVNRAYVIGVNSVGANITRQSNILTPTVTLTGAVNQSYDPLTPFTTIWDATTQAPLSNPAHYRLYLSTDGGTVWNLNATITVLYRSNIGYSRTDLMKIRPVDQYGVQLSTETAAFLAVTPMEFYMGNVWPMDEDTSIDGFICNNVSGIYGGYGYGVPLTSGMVSFNHFSGIAGPLTFSPLLGANARWNTGGTSYGQTSEFVNSVSNGVTWAGWWRYDSVESMGEGIMSLDGYTNLSSVHIDIIGIQELSGGTWYTRMYLGVGPVTGWAFGSTNHVGPLLSNDVWYLLEVTWTSAGTLSLRINGTEVILTAAPPGYTFSGGVTMTLGGGTWDSRSGMQCAYDDWYGWGRALLEGEISYVWNGGTGRVFDTGTHKFV